MIAYLNVFAVWSFIEFLFSNYILQYWFYTQVKYCFGTITCLIICQGLEFNIYPDSKVNGANMWPVWGRQDPWVPHVAPMNFVILVGTPITEHMHHNKPNSIYWLTVFGGGEGSIGAEILSTPLIKSVQRCPTPVNQGRKCFIFRIQKICFDAESLQLDDSFGIILHSPLPSLDTNIGNSNAILNISLD